MGIYDREYYRERTRGSGWLTGTAPVCKAILIINIALFLLPKFLPEGQQLEELFAAYSRLIFEKLQVWRLITATFLISHMKFTSSAEAANSVAVSTNSSRAVHSALAKKS